MPWSKLIIPDQVEEKPKSVGDHLNLALFSVITVLHYDIARWMTRRMLFPSSQMVRDETKSLV